jgi:hypothetical protein
LLDFPSLSELTSLAEELININQTNEDDAPPQRNGQHGALSGTSNPFRRLTSSEQIDNGSDS